MKERRRYEDEFMLYLYMRITYFLLEGIICPVGTMLAITGILSANLSLASTYKHTLQICICAWLHATAIHIFVIRNNLVY